MNRTLQILQIRPGLRLMLSLPPLILPLAGCLTMTPPATGGISQTTQRSLVREFYCGAPGGRGAYVPIQLSHKDTAGTIRQAKANNAVYDRVCGGTPPAK